MTASTANARASASASQGSKDALSPRHVIVDPLFPESPTEMRSPSPPGLGGNTILRAMIEEEGVVANQAENDEKKRSILFSNPTSKFSASSF